MTTRDQLPEVLPEDGSFLPPVMVKFLQARLDEFLGMALAGVGAGLVAVLASYDAGDPSWNTSVNPTNGADALPVRNFLGSFGAYLADALMQSFGLASFTVCAALLGWAGRIGWHRGLPAPRLRALSLALMVTLVAFGLGEHGGVVGALAGANLEAELGRDAAALAQLLCLLLGVLAFCGVVAVSPRQALAGVARWSLKSAAVLGFLSSMAWGFGAWLWGLTRHGRIINLDPISPFMPGDLAPLDADDEDGPRSDTRRFKEPTAPTLAKTGAGLNDKGAGRRGGVGKTAPRQASLDLHAVPELPSLDLLQLPSTAGKAVVSEESLQQTAQMLEATLADFGVHGDIVKVHPGPVVTLYELEPAPGTKSSRVIGLADDIARSMSALSVRVAVVPGRNVIGIEMPNASREIVYLRELLHTDAYRTSSAKLALVLGKDIGGGPVITDLARMPHLLVAGTTGSGKSVAINVMILSLLYRLSPDHCRFIMIDPKMLELSVYEGIPHLLAPVVTEPKKAVVALKWTVREMEDRYRAMSKLGVRNIEGYNARLREARVTGEVLTRRVQTGFDPDTGKPLFEDQPLDLTEIPYIVVIVDEMADLMLVAGKDIEAAIQRLAQMARAAGIHLVMATQRPSVDVITGTIKANFPTRISFQVTSKIDSRTILSEQGAEQLLGQGDMLYMAGGGRITRVHGPFVRDEEVESVVRFLKTQGEPHYVESITEDDGADGADGFADEDGGGGGNSGGDELYDRAVALVARERKCSTSFIQRHLQIGYNRAARIVDRMEAEGVVGSPNHVGKREILARNIEERD